MCRFHLTSLTSNQWTGMVLVDKAECSVCMHQSTQTPILNHPLLLPSSLWTCPQNEEASSCIVGTKWWPTGETYQPATQKLSTEVEPELRPQLSFKAVLAQHPKATEGIPVRHHREMMLWTTQQAVPDFSPWILEMGIGTLKSIQRTEKGCFHSRTRLAAI